MFFGGDICARAHKHTHKQKWCYNSAPLFLPTLASIERTGKFRLIVANYVKTHSRGKSETFRNPKDTPHKISATSSRPICSRLQGLGRFV